MSAALGVLAGIWMRSCRVGAGGRSALPRHRRAAPRWEPVGAERRRPHPRRPVSVAPGAAALFGGVPVPREAVLLWGRQWLPKGGGGGGNSAPERPPLPARRCRPPREEKRRFTRVNRRVENKVMGTV